MLEQQKIPDQQLLLTKHINLWLSQLYCIEKPKWVFDGYFNLPLFTQSVCVKRIYSRNFGCSAKEALILLLSQSTLDIVFPKCIVLTLVFWFWFVTIYPKTMYKIHLFLKFQVLREGSSDIASFVEHPVYSISKMHSVLVLVFLFWFTTIHPKSMC